jgi:hypothetical protein
MIPYRYSKPAEGANPKHNLRSSSNSYSRINLAYLLVLLASKMLRQLRNGSNSQIRNDGIAVCIGFPVFAGFYQNTG